MKRLIFLSLIACVVSSACKERPDLRNGGSAESAERAAFTEIAATYFAFSRQRTDCLVGNSIFIDDHIVATWVDIDRPYAVPLTPNGRILTVMARSCVNKNNENCVIKSYSFRANVASVGHLGGQYLIKFKSGSEAVGYFDLDQIYVAPPREPEPERIPPPRFAGDENFLLKVRDMAGRVVDYSTGIHRPDAPISANLKSIWQELNQPDGDPPLITDVTTNANEYAVASQRLLGDIGFHIFSFGQTGGWEKLNLPSCQNDQRPTELPNYRFLDLSFPAVLIQSGSTPSKSVAIVVHGGPDSSMLDGGNIRIYESILAHDWDVVAFDYAGSRFLDSELAQKLVEIGPAALEHDAMELAEYLNSSEYKSISILALSFGSLSAPYIVDKIDQKRLASIVFVAPVTKYKNPNDYRRAFPMGPVQQIAFEQKFIGWGPYGKHGADYEQLFTRIRALSHDERVIFVFGERDEVTNVTDLDECPAERCFVRAGQFHESLFLYGDYVQYVVR